MTLILAACAAPPARRTLPVATQAPATQAPATQAQTQETTAQVAGVPASRLERLKRGVNLTRWFWYPASTSAEYFDGYITDDDLQILSDLGVTHVRLVINPQFLLQPDFDGAPNPAFLAHVDKAIDRLLAKNIAVIVDMHDEAKQKWEQDNEYVNTFEKLWAALAKHFSRRDPDMVLLELLNEPVFDSNPSKWLDIQKRFLQTVRAAAPNHTLIATGPNWGGIDGLLKVTPADDPNVIYSFHFYEPHPFTHQGATWADEGPKALAQMPYPVDRERCDKLIPIISTEASKWMARSYCAENWDAQKVEDRVLRAVNWSKQHNAPIYAGEFGVYCAVAPQQDRLQWLRDVSAIFDKYDIPRAAWGYDDCFGLDRQRTSGGDVYFDKPSARALGFTVK